MVMVEDQFQRELDEYYGYRNDSLVRYTHRIRIDRLHRLIRRFASSTERSASPLALDAGCGFGVYSLLLAEAGCRVIGVDINAEEIARARQWAAARGVAQQIDFRVGDLHTCAVGESLYDLVVCSEVLEHLESPDLGAANLYRALKSGGTAIVSMPNMACLFGLLQWLYRKTGVRQLLGKPPLDLHQIQHSKYWFGNITRILTRAGFVIEDVGSTSHIPFLWSLDSWFARHLSTPSLATRIDEAVSRWPGLNYLGFNFIVVGRKP
jgi:2-polyprenyl-3-methyl-5-hydroxy-6-metoxy-1,4-benzoquinol methylase